MAARADVRTAAAGDAGSGSTDLPAGEAAELAAASWPAVHAGTPATAGARLEVVRTYPLPYGEVWSAVTEPERLGRWFADVTGHLRVGGTWNATFPQGSASGVVAECEPAARIVTSWRWAHEPGGIAPGRLTVTVEPEADATRLLLVHESVTGNATGQAAGWYAHLAGLASHLRGKDRGGADWEAEFARALGVLRAPGAGGSRVF
ncbi:SRPBCC domain-containing protein [Actinopolymorpha singaporensis]|uniref:Uncharacterized conserved protein YndB, AHSA1/START domain n=1 Tax=Actinopolymorpha singaporensis TaxID=117157 RepID=A0A1H1MYX4_9ACTN|nr:SRPBCC domain-containing protein [Actinopolymorpha singaporensis]SDR92023.1 Uncharacterized conserved protein YndB, AHSA1/START domain [Actinopolymorpha singaporensis]